MRNQHFAWCSVRRAQIEFITPQGAAVVLLFLALCCSWNAGSCRSRVQVKAKPAPHLGLPGLCPCVNPHGEAKCTVAQRIDRAPLGLTYVIGPHAESKHLHITRRLRTSKWPASSVHSQPFSGTAGSERGARSPDFKKVKKDYIQRKGQN